MDYYKRVLELADHVQIYFASDLNLADILNDKFRSYNAVDENLVQYWKEVKGRVFRNSFFSEFEHDKHLETQYAGESAVYVDVASLLVSPVKLQFVYELPYIYDYTTRMVDYQISNGILSNSTNYTKSKSVPDEIIRQNMDSLSFFNEKYKMAKEAKDMFPYLTLFRFALEGLMVGRILQSNFFPFLKNAFIPLLRAQRYVTLMFIDLIQREQEYIDKGEAKDFILVDLNEEDTKQIPISEIFNRRYKTESESLTIDIPPVPTTEGAEDIYLCYFSQILLEYMDEPSDRAKTFVKFRDQELHRHPLAHINRYRRLANKLDVHDIFVPFIQGKLLSKTYVSLTSQTKMYSQESLLSSALAIFNNELYKWQESTDVVDKADSELRLVSKFRGLEDNLAGLVDKRLATHFKAEETLQTARDNATRVGYLYE